MTRFAPKAVLAALLCSSAAWGGEPTTLRFDPGVADATLAVRSALEGVTTRDVRLVFAPGRYAFGPESAAETYLAITNHDNGPKRVVFPMDRFDSVTIEGNGAEFVFRGRVLPFLFKGCRQVELRDLSIDWEIPYYFQATVMAVDPEGGWMDLAPATQGFSWRVRGRKLVFPDIDGFSYAHPGETLAFDPARRRVAHGAWDLHLEPATVERRPDGLLRLHAAMEHLPAVGTVIVAKGRMGENRYAPAVHGIESSDLRLENVAVHHALGMGFLFERCEDIVLRGCSVEVRDGSDRMVSALADATHFCNCKGQVLVEDCRFRHMLDDGTNVHGTYVLVDAVLDERRARVRLMHPQQFGFRFAGPGDEVWIVNAPDPGRSTVRAVVAFEALNEEFSVVTFDAPLDNLLRPGDLLENKTWNPSFTMRGCTIADHRARGIVIKTPHPVVIEDNDLSSMMSGIFLRGESRFWYESGAVEDVLVRGNRFEHCAHGGMEHAVLTVTPRLGERFDATEPFDRNIRFVGNTIRTSGNRVVWADRVTGLLVADNVIVRTEDLPVLYPEASMIDLKHCRDARVERNRYEGPAIPFLSTDAVSGATLTLLANEGF